MIARALTIAGSDSGGGAGIQADLKTFACLGVFGTSAITALTAQNTTGVYGVMEVDPAFVARQIEVVVTDIGVDAAKTGMLSSSGTIAAVADRVRTLGIRPLVVDPVLVASSGARLLRQEAIQALKQELLPLAEIVTPNLAEATALTGVRIRTLEQMREAARALHRLGPRAVLVKGGHLEGAAVDLLYDGQAFWEFEAARLQTPHTHGTGCILSAAMAGYLARGLPLPEAVAAAKTFVTEAIQGGLPLGHGAGPANPLAAGSAA